MRSGSWCWSSSDTTNRCTWGGLLIFALLQVFRLWILMSLGRRWTTRIIVTDTPLVARGPYRWVNHPNYLLVICEIAVAPLVLGLWWIAIVFSVLNAVVLTIRIRAENDGARPRTHRVNRERHVLERVLSHPRYLLLCLALLLIALLARVGSLGFDADINRVFISDSPLSQAQTRFEAQYATKLSDVVVFVEAADALTADQIGAARNMALDFELTPGVAAVVSPFALRFPPKHETWPDAPVIPPDPSRTETDERLAAFDRLETGLPTFISRDALLIVASVDTAARPLDETLGEFRELIGPYEDGALTVTVTGPDVMGSTIRAGLADDLLRLNLVGAALVAIAALAFLRDARLAVAAVLPALLGMVASVGVAAWLGIPITVLNNVIPMLMLIIGVANGLHLAVHLARSEGTIVARVVDTLRTVGPASLLTAITTAIAFAAIMVTSNPQLFEFALLGSLSMVVSMLLLLVGFAALAVLLDPRGSKVGGGLAGFAARFGTAAARAPHIVAAGSAVLLMVACLGFASTTAWFPFGQYLPSTSDLLDANDRIAERFGGVFRAWVEMPPGTEWSELVSAVEAVEAVTPPGSVVSEVAIARWSGDAGTPPPPDALDRLPAAAVERLTDAATGIHRFAVSVLEPMRSDATLAAYDAVEAAALDAGAERVIGLPAIMRHGSVDLIRELSLGLLLASAGGALVVALAFRSLFILPVALVVNLLPVLVVGCAPHILNQGHLTPPLTLALTVAFGIAIDDTVHLLLRYHQALRSGLAASDALAQALKTAGGVMTMTTILLIVGLAVTAFSVFHPVRLFGATLSLSLLAALLTDLVLLPALLTLGARHDLS